MNIILYVCLAIIGITIIAMSVKKKKLEGFQSSQFAQLTSDYKYSVYKSPLYENPRSLTLLFEGNKIDDLGYLIYRDHTDQLEEEDILIKDNETQEVMKIVKDSDSESMVSVNDPIKGHIGYLQFETIIIIG